MQIDASRRNMRASEKWENKVGEEQAMCNPCHQEENKLEVQNRQQQQKYNTEKIQGH